LKNPPILILDEATSALDNISERRVQRALAESRSDRTVILVAHRLSTLRDTDRILVFDNGRVVESGTYDDLVRAGGVFTELLHCAENAASPSPSPEADGERVGEEARPESAPAEPEAAAVPTVTVNGAEVMNGGLNPAIVGVPGV
jgi:ABC-type multidrug transport system ATPase subunit